MRLPRECSPACRLKRSAKLGAQRCVSPINKQPKHLFLQEITHVQNCQATPASKAPLRAKCLSGWHACRSLQVPASTKSDVRYAAPPSRASLCCWEACAAEVPGGGLSLRKALPAAPCLSVSRAARRCKICQCQPDIINFFADSRALQQTAGKYVAALCAGCIDNTPFSFKQPTPCQPIPPL